MAAMRKSPSCRSVVAQRPPHQQVTHVDKRSCNQHGERASTIVVGTERVLSRGKWRTIEVLACPVTWRPHPEQIASARRGYVDWWQALDWVRDGLIAGEMLREVQVTDAMPKSEPWKWRSNFHRNQSLSNGI